MTADIAEKEVEWIGVYPSGHFKHGSWFLSDVVQAISYNINMRPGRALIVDGYIVYIGFGVSDEQIRAAMEYRGMSVKRPF